MPALTKPRRNAAPRKAKSLAERKARKPAKPDMQAFAARCLARLKDQYGDRVAPDSTELLEELRADRF